MIPLRLALPCLAVFLVTVATPIVAQDETPAQPLLKPFSFGGRSGPMRDKFLKWGGGTGASQAAVARGLEWLDSHQNADGKWTFDGDFPDRGQGNEVAATALALLPFLGAGKSHRGAKDNPYDRTVDRGLKFLVARQYRKTGSFDGDLRAHALATMTICEAFAVAQDYALKKPAQLALDHLVDSQQPGGGWPTEGGKPADTPTTGWAVLTLRTGLASGMDVPYASLTRSLIYFESVCEKGTEGYGRTADDPTPELTALGLLCRQNAQTWGSQNLRLIKGIDNYIKPNSPKEGRNQAEFRFFATQVMYHFGGTDWKAWNVKTRDLLVKTQDRGENLSTQGSWSPEGDPLAKTGGRLGVTTLDLLTLETYYRQVSMQWKGD